MRDSAAALSGPLPDNRTDFVYDPLAVLRAAAAQEWNEYKEERARMVLFLRLSSAMPRGADVANMTTKIAAFNAAGSELAFPPAQEDDYAAIRVVKIDGAKADKGALARRDGRRVTSYTILPTHGEPGVCTVRALARYVRLTSVASRYEESAGKSLILSVQRKNGRYDGLSNDAINNITTWALGKAGRPRDTARSTRPAVANHFRASGARDDTIEALGRWAANSTAMRRNYVKIYSDSAIAQGFPSANPSPDAGSCGLRDDDEAS
jgi:hypothetical protein